MHRIADYVSLKRRYNRSINLERDRSIAEAVSGYVLTPRAVEALQRFLESASRPNTIRAWTITGVYGAGKSAFAHFLASLCSPIGSLTRLNAVKSVRAVPTTDKLLELVHEYIPRQGFIRAVVTAQREPISSCVVRALALGVKDASVTPDSTPVFSRETLSELESLVSAVESGTLVPDDVVLKLVRRISSESTGLILIIDELGKVLEYVAHSGGAGDLYLLQQIAELPSGANDPKVFILGLLHQSFSDYGSTLSRRERNEWAKTQGRFEDIPFGESSGDTLRLLAQAFEQRFDHELSVAIDKWANSWSAALKHGDTPALVETPTIRSLYPIHPITGLALPGLCIKYSQNDRTLFTFLGSREPYSLSRFAESFCVTNDSLPTLKLYWVYDYFVESAGVSVQSRPHLQRWAEINGKVAEASHLDPDLLAALKAIAVLNLLSGSGPLRASRDLVVASLCDSPAEDPRKWHNILDTLVSMGLVTHRRRIDEYRIWEGSDFDAELEIAASIDRRQSESVAALLRKYLPLTPMIAHRHSYKTGTTRFFARQYAVDTDLAASVADVSAHFDGVVLYVIGEIDRSSIPSTTEDGRPVVLVSGRDPASFERTCREYVALKDLMEYSPQLQSDGVARREIAQRLTIASRVLKGEIDTSFDPSQPGVRVIANGTEEVNARQRSLSSILSDLCDKAYSKGPVLWNELINRNSLTSQGSRAHRELLEAMIERGTEDRLGITGHGPEYSMYLSLLRKSRIHRPLNGKWGFGEPNPHSGIYHIWKATLEYCRSAKDSPKSVSDLYKQLSLPPYGAKSGIIPVILLSVMLAHTDDIGFYMDGTFVPIIGSPHFELLVKAPERFSVRDFSIHGLRLEVFRELETIVMRGSEGQSTDIRNSTILRVVRPLIQFVNRLTPYARQTCKISDTAAQVRSALLSAIEPDELLFTDLPKAYGIDPIDQDSTGSPEIASLLKSRLIDALRELHTAYDRLIEECRAKLCEVFGTTPDSLLSLRARLSSMANHLIDRDIGPELRRFVFVLADTHHDVIPWLESLMMVCTDKPPRRWDDSDCEVFSTRLLALSRAFSNTVSLATAVSGRSADTDSVPRRMALTYPDGREIQETIWINPDDRRLAEQMADHLISSTLSKRGKSFGHALVTVLIERLLPGNVKEALVEGSGGDSDERN